MNLNPISPVLIENAPPDIKEELTKANLTTEEEVYLFLKNHPEKLISFMEKNGPYLLSERSCNRIAARCFSRLNKLFLREIVDQMAIKEICHKMCPENPSFLLDCLSSFQGFTPLIESLKPKSPRRLTDLALDATPITDENIWDVLICSNQAQFEKLYHRAVNLVSRQLRDDNVQSFYQFAKENDLFEIKRICADYLLDRMSEILPILANSMSPKKLIETLTAIKAPEEGKKKKSSFVNTLTKSLVRKKATQEEALDFMRLAVPILREQTALSLPQLEQFSPQDLITLFYTIPEAFEGLRLKRYSDEEAALIIRHVPQQIRSIDLSRITVDNASLKRLARCPIESLTLNQTFKFLNQPWTNLNRFRNLKKLEVTNCLNLTAKEIELLLSNSPDLEIFKLGLSGDLQPSKYESYDYQLQYRAQRSIEKKTKGALSRFRNYGDYILHLIGTFCPKIKELNLNGLNISSVQSLKKENLERIERLNLSRCLELSQGELVALLQNCPNLRSLDISKIPLVVTDSLLYEIAPALPHLEELNLNWNHACTGKAIIEMARYCKGLKNLQVKFCSLNESDLIKISERCPRLESLTTGEKLTDWGMMAILRNHRFVVLDLDSCACLTDTFLQALEKQPYLQCLGLVDNEKMSDEAIARLIGKLPDIRQLELARLTNVGSQTLEALKKCPHLEFLSLDYTPVGYNLTDPSAEYLEDATFKKLRYLSLDQTGLSSSFLVKIMRCFPHVEILHLGQEDREAKLVEYLFQFNSRLRSLKLNCKEIGPLLAKYRFPCLEQFCCMEFPETDHDFLELIKGSQRLSYFWSMCCFKHEYPILLGLSKISRQNVLKIGLKERKRLQKMEKAFNSL